MDLLTDILASLALRDYLVLFLIIALGMAVGNITIKGFNFDVSAVIFVAILVGWAFNAAGVPFSMPKIVENIGLILFIYTIGIQAGPSFFDAFRSQGKKLVCLTLLIIAVGGIVTMACEYFSGVDMVMGVGLFNGAMTSTPGLAAAIESASRVGGVDPADASIGYGIAYPFGVIGVVLFVKLSYKLFGIDIKKEEEKYRNEITANAPQLIGRNFIVTNENVDGKNLKQLKLRFMTKANVSRIVRKDGQMIAPEADEKLYLGDMIRAVGTEDALERMEVLVGKRTDAEVPSSGMVEVRWYLVTNKPIVGKAIIELNLMENFKATAVRIRRSGIEIAPHPSTQLRYGDKILVSSSKGNVKGLSDLFGDSMKQLSSTSFMPIALGIILGVLVGSISIPLFGMDFSLGLTGGTLLTALFLSYKGKTGPVIWAINGQANALLRQLGLLMFLTPVGIKAGENLVETLEGYGLGLFGIGMLITLTPMIIATLIGYFMMKINFLTLMGTLTGGMTSTPGLSSVDSLTETDAPQVAYAAVYPFALVAIIIMSQILVIVPQYF